VHKLVIATPDGIMWDPLRVQERPSQRACVTALLFRVKPNSNKDSNVSVEYGTFVRIVPGSVTTPQAVGLACSL
jgi:hypothetical protein